MAAENMPWLDVRDVARILGQERERVRQIRAGVPHDKIDVSGAAPLAEMTVRSYAYRQRNPGDRRQYQDMATEGRQFPPATYPSGEAAPKRGEHPVWPILAGETRDEVADRFRQWYRARPGQGQRGGRPRKDAPPPAAPDPGVQPPAGTRRKRGSNG